MLRRADLDEDAIRLEHTPQLGDGPRGSDVDHGVIPLGAARDPLLRVVDDQVGAKRPHHVDVARAGHGSDLRSERLRDLHCERAYAAARSVDEHALSRLDLRVVP